MTSHSTLLAFILTSLVGFGKTGLAQETSTPTRLFEFMKQQRERRFERVPREVLAFYYTWYGRPERHNRWVHWDGVKPDQHEIATSTHYPARGAYDSHDPELIDWHIDLAKSNGLTGFIATWWGQRTFDDRAFQVLLERAEQKNFKVTVYWETAPGEGENQVIRAVNDLAYVLQQYGASRAFLKVNGRPVIFVYGRVMGEVPLDSWPAIITGARKRAGDFLLIADGYQAAYARLFDGVHTYNVCGWVQGKPPAELRAYSANSYAGAVKLAKDQGAIACVTIIPGYDDTKIRKPGLNAERQTGQTYRVLWEEAIKADPDWVLITSWNEWHEGSEIEPSWEDGDTYLKLTAPNATRFRRSPFSQATGAAGVAKLAPAKLQALRKLYTGRTIGLLPDFGGDAAFWLLDAGVQLRELSWADLVDPRIFNARQFPLVLHAGGEHYVRTVKTERDVERALQRYLAEGGFLLAIPHLPFPFFYDNAAGGQPANIASQVGFPITGGWESPPASGKLTFHIATSELPGLPVAVPFPQTGDLRWRPAVAARINEGDLYVSLAALREGGGKSLGDGIAYIEHKVPPLAPGRNLYVWMRMPEILGKDQFLLSLFQFAGEKLPKAP